jgi:hypothetical protein
MKNIDQQNIIFVLFSTLNRLSIVERISEYFVFENPRPGKHKVRLIYGPDASKVRKYVAEYSTHIDSGATQRVLIERTVERHRK